MLILFILYTLDESHFASNGLVLQTNMFKYNKEFLQYNNIEVHFLEEYIPIDPENKIPKGHIQSHALINFLKEYKQIEKFDNVWVYSISHGFDALFKDNFFLTHGKKIIFTDDPHAYFIKNNAWNSSNLWYLNNNNPTCLFDNILYGEKQFFLEYNNIICSPSISVFENIKYPSKEKLKLMNYCIDETFDIIINNNKKNKILLSGSITSAYPLRKIIHDKLNVNDTIYTKYFEKLHHCGYNNNSETAIKNKKYIYKLAEYKGCLVDLPIFPLNYPVYKHLEILQSGSLCFSLYHENLEKYLKLKMYYHYIPIFIENNEIVNLEEIINYLDSDKGDIIAKRGQKYVNEYFNSQKIVTDFINIINPTECFYQVDYTITLNMLKLGKSLVRFGDGDFLLMMDTSVATQENNNKLKQMYIDLFTNQYENIMIAVPPLFIDYHQYHNDKPNNDEKKYYNDFYNKHKKFIDSYLNKTQIYHDACIFRSLIKLEIRKIITVTLRTIFKNKNVIVVIGENTYLQQQKLFNKYLEICSKYKFIFTNSINSFTLDYERVKIEIKDIIHNYDIILIMSGTLRVLACDFLNTQVIDLGSFLNGPLFFQ